jgi:hypothetical protein
MNSFAFLAITALLFLPQNAFRIVLAIKKRPSFCFPHHINEERLRTP